MSSARDDADGARSLVRKHRVCWDVWPVRSRTKEGMRVVAYQIDLVGTYAPGEHAEAPGDESSRHVYDDLLRIARLVLPPPEAASEYDVGVFDAALHYSARRNGRPDVCVSITIHHGSGWDEPADDGEMQCVKAITQRLAGLGAHEGAWPLTVEAAEALEAS